MSLIELIAEKVREMDNAAYHAMSSAGPSSCGVASEMPCRHAHCIERAASNAAYWTHLAVRCAITLESLVEPALEGYEDAAAKLLRLRRHCHECRRQSADDWQTPAEAECIRCGELDCPHSEGLHYHHDGCPACINDPACPPTAARLVRLPPAPATPVKGST